MTNEVEHKSRTHTLLEQIEKNTREIKKIVQFFFVIMLLIMAISFCVGFLGGI